MQDAVRSRAARCALLFTCVLALAPFDATPARGEELPASEDVLLVALRDLGVDPEHLGYAPHAHWPRCPHPATIPHVMPFFADLFARPADTYEFVRTLGNAVEDGMTTEVLRSVPDPQNRREALALLAMRLGTERRIGGMRGFSVNLDAAVGGERSLADAIDLVFERAGAPRERGLSFGGAYGEGGETPRAALAKRLEAVPEPLRGPLARLVMDLVDARRWIDLGLRRITPAQRRAVFDALPRLAGEAPEGLGYEALLDEVVPLLDEHSLHYGALKAAQALHDARRALGAVPVEAYGTFDVREPTPYGEIRFRSGTAEAVGSDEAPFCYVQVGSQTGPTAIPLGTTTAERPLSVALLFEHGDLDGTAGGRLACGGLGSGVLGCGAVLAVSARPNATVRVKRAGLGAGLCGFGLWLSESGDTTYEARSFAQGAAMFGTGLMLDAEGNDAYSLAEGDGQGYGGPNGVGVLADRRGNDRYASEADAKKAGRADYHSANAIAVSMAQGAGTGRRADGSDGHSWAGGLGALLDVEGDDVYDAGNFSQGIGYWYGTGILWDGGGNDVFRSVYFTQGSGAHFAIGALIDEGGNDVHELRETSGAGLGFGWDVVNAFLIDRGRGDDRYEAKIISLGVAEVRSNAFFLDEGGDDVYVVTAKGRLLGAVDARPSYDVPHRTAPYERHIGQIGLFLDLGGNDRYEVRGDDGATAPSALAANDRTWNLLRATRARGFNVSLGRDIEDGRSTWLTGGWPPR